MPPNKVTYFSRFILVISAVFGAEIPRGYIKLPDKYQDRVQNIEYEDSYYPGKSNSYHQYCKKPIVNNLHVFFSASNFPPRGQFFNCYDGQVLAPESVCNGISECSYGEDESNCDNSGTTSIDNANLDPSLIVPVDQASLVNDGSQPNGVNTGTYKDIHSYSYFLIRS